MIMILITIKIKIKYDKRIVDGRAVVCVVVIFATVCVNMLPPLNASGIQQIGKGQSLIVGRLRSPVVVLTVATLTTPSCPGCTSVIRPSFQHNGGVGSRIRTNVSTVRFFCPVDHFDRS